MRKYRKLLLAAAATTVAAVTVTGVAAASASPVTGQAISGIEYVQIMSTSATGPASAIAGGVFAAGGQARLGDASGGTIAFPGGTIVLSHRPTKSSSHFYPEGCLSLIGREKYLAVRQKKRRCHTRRSAVPGPGHQSGGCRSFHGRACSSWADREIKVASSPIRPASITPIGRPSAFQYSGRLTAGCPDTL